MPLNLDEFWNTYYFVENIRENGFFSDSGLVSYAGVPIAESTDAGAALYNYLSFCRRVNLLFVFQFNFWCLIYLVSPRSRNFFVMFFAPHSM